MSLPLAGFTVLDLTQIYNGPYCTFLLASAGAEVIKIEPPGGEHLRKRQASASAALPFAMLNAHKRSLRLDLKTERGRELLLALAKTADVLVENFAPGAMDRLGLSRERFASVNPNLIYAASNGYGSTGPYRDYPAMDLTVQAMVGVMSVTGFPDGPPVKAGPQFCDFIAGVHLYGAIVTALLDSARTGQVRAVEVAMLEASYFALSSNLAMLHGSGRARAYRQPPEQPVAVPLQRLSGGRRPCRDHHQQRDPLAGAPDGVRPRAGRRGSALPHRQGPRAPHGGLRCHDRRLDAAAAQAGGVRAAGPPSRAGSTGARAVGGGRGSASARARLAAAGRASDFGAITVPASPLHFAGLAPRPHVPSVPLGQDSRAVLAERLGLDDAALDQLEADKVI